MTRKHSPNPAEFVAQKRYALFAYDFYYPNGGWSDLVGLFDTPEEVGNAKLKCKSEYMEVVDLFTGKVVHNLDYELVDDVEPDVE